MTEDRNMNIYVSSQHILTVDLLTLVVVVVVVGGEAVVVVSPC